MKSVYEIDKMIRDYTDIINEYYSQPEDRDERDKIKGKIEILKWVLDED